MTFNEVAQFKNGATKTYTNCNCVVIVIFHTETVNSCE